VDERFGKRMPDGKSRIPKGKKGAVEEACNRKRPDEVKGHRFTQKEKEVRGQNVGEGRTERGRCNVSLTNQNGNLASTGRRIPWKE